MKLGNSLMRMSPMLALIVVLSQALVLLLFSSITLHNWLAENNLPTLPLVPVSSTQAVIGAIIGIGIAKGGRNLDWRMIGKIAIGWIAAPLLAMLICFVSLFFFECSLWNKTNSFRY